MIDDILLFVQVVNAGSVNAAAKRQKLSLSTLSRRLKSLEQELGVPLFERDAHRLVLTPRGKAIYQQFEDYEQILKKRLAPVIKEKQAAVGPLNVMLSFSLAHYVVLPYLDEFIQRYPELKLSVYYNFSPFNIIREGYDLAIINFIPKQQSQKLKTLAFDKVIIVCARQYIERYGLLDRLDQVPPHACIGRHLPLHDYIQPQQLYHEDGDEPCSLSFDGRVNVSNFVQAKQLIRGGNLIGGLPRYLIKDELASGEFVRVLPDYHLGVMRYFLLRTIDEHDERFRAFYQFVQECLARVFPQSHLDLDLTQTFSA